LTFLRENRDKLEALAEKLLEKEVIFKEDLVAIFGERTWDKEAEELLLEKHDDEPLLTSTASDATDLPNSEEEQSAEKPVE
jgi:hypothetical protein